MLKYRVLLYALAARFTQVMRRGCLHWTSAAAQCTSPVRFRSSIDQKASYWFITLWFYVRETSEPKSMCRGTDKWRDVPELILPRLVPECVPPRIEFGVRRGHYRWKLKFSSKFSFDDDSFSHATSWKSLNKCNFCRDFTPKTFHAHSLARCSSQH